MAKQKNITTAPYIPLIEPPMATKMDQLFLQQQYGGYIAPPMDATPLPGISTTPPYPNFDIERPDLRPGVSNDGPMSLDDILKMGSAAPDTFGGGQAYTESDYIGNSRYSEGIVPGRDNEDAAAQNQSWYNVAINGVTKGLSLAGTTFLQTTVGSLNGLAQWANTGRFASFYDNEFNRSLDEFNVSLENAMPSYETQQFKNAKWYSPDYLFTGNFFWEGIIKNLGFAAGAAASGYAFSGILKGLGAASRLTALGKGKQTITAAEEALALGEGGSGFAARLAGLTKELGGIQKIQDFGFRATVSGLSTTGEAAIEAYHNLNEFRDTAIEDFKEKHGYEPVGDELAKINEAADNIGNASFKMNMALLGVTNYIQFPTILGKNFKTNKAVSNNMAPKIKDFKKIDGKYVVTPATKLERLGKAIKNPYIFSYSEALEESSQFAISNFTDDFFNKRYRGEDTGDTFNDAMSSIKFALEEAISDEGMKNLLIGGLSGAIMLGPGRVKSGIQKSANTGKAIKEVSKTDLSPFIKDTQDSVNRGQTLEEEYLYAIENDDQLAANESENDYVLNYLLPRIKWGRHDLVLQEIQDMKDLLKTPTGFDQLVAEGKVKEGDTKEAVLSRLESLENTSVAVANVYNEVNLKYKGLADEDGNRLYPDEVIDKLVYAGAKIHQYNKQIPALISELTAYGINAEPAMKGDEVALEEAQLAILDLEDLTNDQAEDLVEKLNRVAVMNQYKKKMLRDYADIKTNPENHFSKPLKDVETKEDVKGEETVLIKTERYPQGRKYKKGKKYVLGNVFDEDEKGNQIYRFPTLTFIGENEDGTVKIEDNKGVIRDVSKEVFEDYNLGSEEAIEKSPDAKFFRENANKIAYWNTGKKKAGEIKGRIKWDPEKDNLVFVYKSGKKIVEKIINADSFQAKPGYKKGIFHFGAELSAVSKDLIEEANKSGRTAEKIKARQEQRAEILTELYVEVSEKHEKTEKLIEKKKNDLATIKKQLAALKEDLSKNAETKKSATKNIRFKKVTNEAMGHTLKLSRMIADLEREVEELEDQNSSTEQTLSFIEDLLGSLEQLPDSTKDFMKELEGELDTLQLLTVNTNDQINAIKSLIKSAKDTLNSAVKYLTNLISGFESRYPNVPRFMGQGFVDFLKENPNFLKLKPNYREELKAIEEEIAFVEDNTITPSEARIANLEEHLAKMEDDMTQLELKARGVQTVIDKFQGIYDTYMAEKAVREALALDTKLQEEIIGTLDPGVPSNRGGDGYEADAKKDAISVGASTTTSTKFTEPDVLRAQRFAFRFKRLANSSKLKAIVVTKANEHLLIPGLTQFIKDEAAKNNRVVSAEKSIYAVWVEVNKDGTYELVGEDGKKLTSAQKGDAVNNAIYQPFPLENLEAIYPDGKASMFRNGTPQKTVDTIKEQYKTWRELTLKQDTLGEPRSMVPSFGHPIYEKKWITNKNGEQEQVPNKEAKNSVTDAGLIEKADLQHKQVLQVATTNETIYNNGVTYKTPLGRVFLNIIEGLVPMSANKLSKKKSETIYKVLHKISNDLATRGTISEDNQKLFKWLRTVVQWGTPKIKKDANGKVIDSAPGYSSLWFDYEFNEVTQGMEPRLFMSGLGYSIPLTPTSLEENETEVTATLQNLYHNVKSKWTNQEHFNIPYTEITDIDENGNVITETWQNYQTYLLSDEGRSIDETPLTTPYAALIEDEDINRNGIYFTFENAEEMFTLETVEEEDTTTEEPPTDQPPSGRVTTIPVLDGKTDNVYVLSNNKSFVLYRANSKGEITNFQLFEADDIITKIMQIEKGKGGVTQEDQLRAVELFKSDLKNKILAEIVVPSWEAQMNPTDNVPLEEDDFVDPFAEDGDLGETNDIELFRIAVESDPYEKTENWNKVEKWTKRNFGNVPFFRVQNLIRATKGRKALGMFHRAAIYVYEGAEAGTTYHEVFEGVWKMFTDQKERKQIIDEFRSRKGTFEDRETRRTIKYSEATYDELKEELAEEFRRFRLKREKYDTNTITRFFRDLLDYVKQIFDWFNNEPQKIEEYFKAIDKGKYKSVSPDVVKLGHALDGPSLRERGFSYLENATGDETSEFSIVSKISVPTRELNDVMQHMTFQTINSLFKNDDSLMDTNSYNKTDLYFNLKQSLKDRFRLTNRKILGNIQRYKQLKNAEKTKQFQLERIANAKLWNSIESSWSAIVERHIENLQTYNIIFDDNDYVLLNDENNSGREDYIDARKVDPFKKSSAAIKLMLASIPMVDENGKAKLSSINGVITMDIGESYLQLMDKLSSAKGIDDMLMRLNKLGSFYPNYRLLYERLTGDKYTPVNSEQENVDPPSFKKLTRNKFELVSSFWRTFKKQKPDIITVFVLQDGSTVVSDSSLTSTAKSGQFFLRNKIINGIKSNKGDGLFVVNKGKWAAIKGNGKGFDLVNLNPASPETYSKFLERFGIDTFTPGTIKNFTEDQKNVFFKRVEGIKNELMKIDDVSSLTNNTLNMEQDLFQLGLLKATVEHDEYQSTYFNVNGEMSQTFIGPNALSNLYHTLDEIDNLNELEDTEYDYLTKDPFSINSLMLKKLFDDNGVRLPNTKGLLKPVFIDGTINEQEGVRKDSSSLSYMQRVTQEMNANLEGIYMNLVPGDASIEWALKMHNKNNPFVTVDSIESKDYLKIFKDYLIDEINLAKQTDRAVVNSGNKGKLRFFSDILPVNLQKAVLAPKSAASKVVYSRDSKNFKGLEDRIDEAIHAYVEKRASQDKALLKEYRLFYKNKENLINVPKVNFPENMSETSFNKNLQALAANYMIANIEMHKLVYGDPYHYSDELKRIKSFSSPRQALIHGSSNLNTSLDEMYNEDYNEGDAGWSDMFNPNLRTVTLGDVISGNRYLGELASNLKDYLNGAEETDGGGITTIKGKRKIMLRAGMWTERLEAQYRYEIAYEDYFEGKDLTPAQLKIFNPANPDQLNPGVQDLFTPLKPIVSGRKGNERAYNDTMLDKFALLPLSYRSMHKMGADSNMLALYKKMQSENIDYAVFASGRKVGAENVFPSYKNGKINSDPFETKEQKTDKTLPQTVINVPFSIISIQTDVPTKESGGTTQGSQITKLATLDMMEAGVPIDYKIYKGKEEITDITERYESWLSIAEGVSNFEEAEDIRATHSPLYKEIVNNRRLLEAKTNLGYKKLISSLGITKDANGNLSITKRDRMASTLRDEIFSRAVNDNVSEAFQGFLDGDVVLEGTPLYQQIRNVLFSIVRKNIVRPKINGGFKVQFFNTFFEDNRVDTMKDSKGNEVYTSGDLKFYKDEDGQRVCEIMVARWFNSPLTDDEILDTWYVLKDGKRTDELTEEGKKVLEGIGYRIPTQKQNSIDAFRIKKLLPKEMKDTVIVPTDLVKKVGSDFDIDKLSIYLKNVKGGRRIKALKFLTDENSSIEERYFEWVKDIAGYDSKNYYKFLASDEVAALRKKHKIQKQTNRESFLEARDAEKLEYKEKFEELFSEKKEATTDQDALIRDLFEDGKKDFWKLSPEILTHFKVLKNDMAVNGVNGSIEIENYLALANGLITNRTTPSQDKLALVNVIENYKKVLEALGYSGDVIQEIQDDINKVKDDKSESINELIAEIQKVTSENRLKYLDSLQEINVEWAKNVARVENLETIEAFSNLSIYEQNASKNLDNAYIDSLFELTTHPLNFNRLVVPNSAKIAKKLADDITELLGKDKINYSLPGNMLSRSFMSGLRQAFVSGKYAIGISAVAQTNHAQNQRTPIVLDEKKLVNLSSYDSQYLTDTKINFRKHNQLDGKVSLSGIFSADGKSYISDVIGMFIDGYVDISKGPWIMQLGATSRLAGTWLFLLKAGVPLRDVAFFMNQPIINQYVKELESDGRQGLFSKGIIDYVMDEYTNKSKAEQNLLPTTQALKEMVGKPIEDLGEEQKAQQQYILTEFLKYAKMGEQLLTYVQGSNFDTANFNDPLLVFKKAVQLELAEKSIVSSVQENLQSSFVGNLFKMIQQARDGFSDLLVSDSKSTMPEGFGPRDVVEAILKPYVSPYINDKKFVKMGRKAIENLFDWTMQTGSMLNGKLAEAFFDSTDSLSTLKQLMAFKESVKRNQNHPMYNNIIINNLLLDPTGRANQVDNIYLKAKNNRSFDQNLVINSFRELREYFEGRNSDMFDKFMRLAILQSGLTNSYLSFVNLLPYEEFKKYYNNYISLLPSNPTLIDFLEMNEFQRTNPTDKDIVPALKAKDGVVERQDFYGLHAPVKQYWNTATTFMNENLKKAMSQATDDMIYRDLDYYPFPKLINVGKRSFYGASDILSWYWEEVPLTSKEAARNMKPWAKKQEMMKKGDYSFRRKGLFKKVYTVNEDGMSVPLIQKNEKKNKRTGETKIFENFVYKLINTRGHGPRAQEHYSKKIASDSSEVLGKRSIIDNDFVNVVEVSDKRIVEIFDGNAEFKPSVAPVSTVNIPKDIDMSKFPINETKLFKEITKLKAKLYLKSRRLQIKNTLYDPGFYNSPKFREHLVSLEYTPEQIGAIIKLTC